MKKYRAGFTLIELMIVVAVVGILAAIAYPSYRESILKGRRAEARAALTDLLQQQERYLTQRNTYLAFLSGAATSAAQPFKTYTGDNSANPLYKIGAQACPSTVIRDCVELIATPTGSDPAVGDIFIRSSGVKGCSATATNPAARCWK